MASDGWLAHGPWLLAGVFALTMALVSEPLTIPDSFELMAEGSCLLGQSEWSRTCEGLNPAYWTPGWSIPVGILTVILSPMAAAGVVSLISMSLLVVPCWSIARRLGGDWAGLIVGLLIVATPALRTYGLLADGRGMALLCLFGAWALALRSVEDGGSVWPLCAGAMAGMGVLVRPEGVLTLGLIPLFLFLFSRSWRRSGMALLGGLGIAAPWWGILSMHRSALQLTPRDWESSGFPLLELIPKREVLELYGMGAADTPFRKMALNLPVTMEGVGLDFSGGARWLGMHLPQAIPLWALLLAGLGLILASRMGQFRTVLALTSAALPSLVAAFKPQSRDVLLPMANLLPVIVCGWILAALALFGMVRWSGRGWKKGTGQALIVGVCGSTWFWGPRVDLMPATELLDPGRQAAAWLRNQPESKVRASFESAPVVHLSGQEWDPWPSRWDPAAWSEDRISDLILFTDLDDYANIMDVKASLKAAGDADVTPVAYYGDDRAWVLILAVSNP